MTVKKLWVLATLIISLAFISSACIKKLSVNEVLPVKATLTKDQLRDQLIDRINTYAEVKSFSAETWFQVVNYFTGDKTKAEQFPAGIGKLRLMRPENIRIAVTAPVVSKRIADMLSDGNGFKLALYYPSDKRRFIYGNNLKEIERMAAEEIKGVKDKDLQRAGGVVNMRPQHVTDSILIKPITDRNNTIIEEVRQPELVAGKKDRWVERSYYVLYVSERNASGQLELRRKFWFDRTQSDAPLVRQQIFENGSGKLASDVTYSEWFKIQGSNRDWFGIVTVDRRADGYRLQLDMDKETIELNGELPATVFQLENKDHLQEINLDEPHDVKADRTSKDKDIQKRKPNADPPK